MNMDEAESRIKSIEHKVDELPDKITAKLSETMDLKIENAIQKVKIEFYKWLVPLCIGTIGALAGAVFSYVK